MHHRVNERGDHFAIAPDAQRHRVLLQTQEDGDQTRIALASADAFHAVDLLLSAIEDIEAASAGKATSREEVADETWFDQQAAVFERRAALAEDAAAILAEAGHDQHASRERLRAQRFVRAATALRSAGGDGADADVS